MASRRKPRQGPVLCKTLALEPTLAPQPVQYIDRRVQTMLDDGWSLACCFYDSEYRTAYYTFVRQEADYE